MLDLPGLALECLPHTWLFIKYTQQMLLNDQFQVMPTDRIIDELDGVHVSQGHPTLEKIK